MPYNYNEVYDATLEYFKGDTLQTDIFVNKYALRDSEDNYYELTPDDMWKRLSKEIVRIDKNYDNSILNEEMVFEIFKENYICPGGSILFGAGNNFTNISLANCYAIPIEDSMSGIFNTARNLANISKRRGGVGVNISSLRPEGASVKNAAKTSSGAWSWGKFISDAAEAVGQNSRRAAVLLLLDVSHPDIFKFISMKDNLNSVNGANISVAITDKFMQAVEEDADWDLVFDNKVYQTVKAKELFNAIAEHAAKTGEPGVIYWDTYANNVPLHHYPGLGMICTNPCLPGYMRVWRKDGKVELDTLKVGDEIWSSEGWTKVIAIYDRGKKEVHKYITTHRNFHATPNHKVMCHGEKVEIKDADVIDNCNNVPEGTPVTDDLKPEFERIVCDITLEDMPVYDITVDNTSHTFWCNGFDASNCGELLLGPENSCMLLANNLSKFVENGIFNFIKYEEYVKYGVRFLDNIIDLEIEAITKLYNLVKKSDEKELYKKIHDRLVGARRIGLGTFGLADTLIKMGIKYDSDEALQFVAKISEIRFDAAYYESMQLALDRGGFPDYNAEYDNNCELINNLCKKYHVNQWDRRNGALLTDPPTGSIATMLGVSTGIEPIFDFEYTRKRKINPEEDEIPDFTDAKGVKFKYYKVKYAPLQKWIEEHPDEKVPDYFVNANEIDWKQRVKLQGLIGYNSDGGVSSTINLPKGTQSDTVKDIYMEAWKQGCKGLTVYVDGSRDGILVRETSCSNKQQIRPAMLNCHIYHEVVMHHGESYPFIIIVGLLDGKPFEIFGGEAKNSPIKKSTDSGIIIKVASGKYELSPNPIELVTKDNIILDDNFNSTVFEPYNRLISLSIQKGATVTEVVDQLLKCKGTDMFAYAKVIARVLSKHYLKDGEASGATCTECRNKTIVFEGGCFICKTCGHSACG